METQLVNACVSSLIKLFNEKLDDFLSKLHAEQNIKERALTKEEMYEIWANASKSPVKAKSPPRGDVRKTKSPQLTSMNVAELKAMCKQHGLRVSGKKGDLIARLAEVLSEPKEEETKEEEEVEIDEDSPKASPRPRKTKLKSREFTIRPNAWGNFEHPETRLVFDRTDKIAIGTQQDDGTIDNLTPSDIENCKKFGFNWTVPEKLESKKEVKIASEADDDDEESEELIEYEDDSEE